MWLSPIALLCVLCGMLLFYKVRGHSDKRWVNTLVGIFAYVFMILGIVLASIAFAGGLDASRL
jgi:hypothetical protein